MIFVHRGPKPKVLQKKETKWLASLKTAATPNAKKLAISKYRHREIREALELMFHGKCAYCESQIKHVAYTNIEHFQPRQGPRGNETLTFSWDNLLLSCAICNGPQYKSDKFPAAADGGPIVNPCVDNPDDHLDFLYDPAGKVAIVAAKTDRGATTEKTVGLNRLDLKVYRSRQITTIAALAKFAASDAEAAKLLDEAKQPNAEYSRFAKLF